MDHEKLLELEARWLVPKRLGSKLELWPAERLIVAMDGPWKSSLELMPKLAERGVTRLKFGLRTIHEVGTPVIIAMAKEYGITPFLDSKLYDIANPTVANAAAEIAKHGPWMFNVMAPGEIKMMMGAVANRGNCLVSAVTVLTSLDDEEAYLAFNAPYKAKVLEFARNAKLAGIRIIICSPLEADLFSRHPELDDMLVMTPGIRPEWAVPEGQSRFTSPREAIASGVSCIIVGSPVTSPPESIGSSEAAVDAILKEIEQGLEDRVEVA